MDGEGVFDHLVIQLHWFNTSIVNLHMIDGYVDFVVLLQDFTSSGISPIRLNLKKILLLHEEIIMGVISVIGKP